MSTDAVKALHSTPGKLWINSNNNQLRYNDDASGTPNWIIPLSVFRVGKSSGSHSPYIKRGQPVSIGHYAELEESAKTTSDPRIVLTNSVAHEWCAGIALEPGDGTYFNDDDTAGLASYQNVHVQSSGHITYKFSDASSATDYIPPHNAAGFTWSYADVGKPVYVSNLEGHAGEFTLDLSEATYNGGKVLTVGRLVNAPVSGADTQEITIDIILDGDTRSVVEATTFEVQIGPYDSSIYKVSESALSSIASSVDRLFCIQMINGRGYFIVNDEMLAARKNHTPVGAASVASDGRSINLTKFFGKTIQVTRLGVLKADTTYGYTTGNIGQELYLNNGEVTPSSPSAIYEYRVGVIYSSSQVLVDCRFPKTDLQKFDRVGDIKPIYVTESNGEKNYAIEPGYVMVESSTIHKVSGSYADDKGNPYTDFSYFIKTIFDKDIVLYTKDIDSNGKPISTATWHRKGEKGFETFDAVKNAYFKFKDLWYSATNVDGSATTSIKTQIKYTAEASPEQMTYLWPEIAEQVTLFPPANTISSKNLSVFKGRKAGDPIGSYDFSLDITSLAEANEYFDENGSSLDAYDIFLYDDKKTLIAPGFYTFSFEGKEVWAGFNWEIVKNGQNIRLNMVTNPGVSNCVGFCWPIGSPITTQKRFNVVIRKRPTQFLGISLNQLYATSPLHKHTTGSNLITQSALFFGTPTAVSGSTEGQPSYYLGQDTVSSITISDSNDNGTRSKYLNYFMSAYKNEDGVYSAPNRIIQRFYALGGPNNAYKTITLDYDFDSNVINTDAYFAPKILATSTETKIGDETNVTKHSDFTGNALRAFSVLPTSLFNYTNDTGDRKRLSSIQDDLINLYSTYDSVVGKVYGNYNFTKSELENTSYTYTSGTWDDILKSIGYVFGPLSTRNGKVVGGDYLCYQSNLGLLNAAARETAQRLLALERALFGCDYDTITQGAKNIQNHDWTDARESISNTGVLRDITNVEKTGLLKYLDSSDKVASDFMAIWVELYGEYETQEQWEALANAYKSQYSFITDDIFSKGKLHQLYFDVADLRRVYPIVEYSSLTNPSSATVTKGFLGTKVLLQKPLIGVESDSNFAPNLEALEKNQKFSAYKTDQLHPYSFNMGYDSYWTGSSPNEAFDNIIFGQISQRDVNFAPSSVEGYIYDLTLKLSKIRHFFDDKHKIDPAMSLFDFDNYTFKNLGDNQLYFEAVPLVESVNANDFYTAISFSKDHRINRLGKLFLNKNTRDTIIFSNIRNGDGTYPSQSTLKALIDKVDGADVLNTKKLTIQASIADKYLSTGFESLYSVVRISKLYDDEITDRVKTNSDDFIKDSGLTSIVFAGIVNAAGTKEIIALYSLAENNETTKIISCYAAKQLLKRANFTDYESSYVSNLDVRDIYSDTTDKITFLKKCINLKFVEYKDGYLTEQALENEINSQLSQVYSFGSNRTYANQAIATIADEDPIASLDYGAMAPGSFSGHNINNYTRLNMVPVYKADDDIANVTKMHTSLGWMPVLPDDAEFGATNTVDHKDISFIGTGSTNKFNNSTKFVEYCILKPITLEEKEFTVTVETTIKEQISFQPYDTSKYAPIQPTPKDETSEEDKTETQRSYTFVFNFREKAVTCVDAITLLKKVATLHNYDENCVSINISDTLKEIYEDGCLLKEFAIDEDHYAVKLMLDRQSISDSGCTVKIQIFRIILQKEDVTTSGNQIQVTASATKPLVSPSTITVNGSVVTTTTVAIKQTSLIELLAEDLQTTSAVADGPILPKANTISLDAQQMYDNSRTVLNTSTRTFIKAVPQYSLIDQEKLEDVEIEKTGTVIDFQGLAQKEELFDKVLKSIDTWFNRLFGNHDAWTSPTVSNGFIISDEGAVVQQTFTYAPTDDASVKLFNEDFNTKDSLLWKGVFSEIVNITYKAPDLTFSNGSKTVVIDNGGEQTATFEQQNKVPFIRYNALINKIRADEEAHRYGNASMWDSTLYAPEKVGYIISIIYFMKQLYDELADINNDYIHVYNRSAQISENDEPSHIQMTYDFKKKTCKVECEIKNEPILKVYTADGISAEDAYDSNVIEISNETINEKDNLVIKSWEAKPTDTPDKLELESSSLMVEHKYDGDMSELSWELIDYVREQTLQFKKCCLENSYYQSEDKQSIVIKKELVEEYEDPDEFNAVQLTPLIQGFKLCKDQIPSKVDFALELTSDNIRDLVKLDVAREVDNSEKYKTYSISNRTVPSATDQFTTSSSTTSAASKIAPDLLEVSTNTIIVHKPLSDDLNKRVSIVITKNDLNTYTYVFDGMITKVAAPFQSMSEYYADCVSVAYIKELLPDFNGYYTESSVVGSEPEFTSNFKDSSTNEFTLHRFSGDKLVLKNNAKDVTPDGYILG